MPPSDTSHVGTYVNIPDTDDAKKVAAAIKEVDNALMMISAQKDHIKDIKKMLKEDYDMTPGSIALMIKLHHKQSADKHFEEQDELHDLYNKLFPTKTQPESE